MLKKFVALFILVFGLPMFGQVQITGGVKISGNLSAGTPVIVNGVERAVEYFDGSGILRRVDLYSDPSITDYSDVLTVGSFEWAINSLGTYGGVVNCNSGIYPVTHAILVDWDWITIQGTNLPYWSAYGTAYPTHQIPGEPGGCQIVAATAINLFVVGNTVANMHGDTRHKGIMWRWLNMYGSYTALSAITNLTLAQGDDQMWVQENEIMGFESCTIVNEWNYTQIVGNSIQSNDGGGVCIPGVGGYINIIDNIIFDNGGVPVTASGGTNILIARNMLGSQQSSPPVAATLSAGSGSFFGNMISNNMPPQNITGGTWQSYGNFGSNSGTVGLTCSGSPTSSFAVRDGLVTHC